jgi:hypothetical protein
MLVVIDILAKSQFHKHNVHLFKKVICRTECKILKGNFIISLDKIIVQ